MLVVPKGQTLALERRPKTCVSIREGLVAANGGGNLSEIYICLYVGRSQMEYVCWVEAMDYDGLAMYECGWAVRLIAVEGCRGARWECGERDLSRAGGWEINQR